MEKESFFTKLRRLGTTVENETARLESNMKKPIGLRSSGNRLSSHLVLKEILHDAQNVKREARQTLSNIKAEDQEFEEIVLAVQALCQTNKTQIQEIEDYLQQYGYTPYQQQQEQQAVDKKCKKGKEDDKENVSQEDKSEEAKPSDGTKEDESNNETNDFVTPPKSVKKAPGTPLGNRTPQLSDFGLSQLTMDRLAMMKMPQPMYNAAPPPGSVQATPAMSDRTYNLSVNPSASRHYPPMTTPLCQQLMPFSQDTVRVTPGLFGNRVVPTGTPEHFIDKALPKPDMEDSPIPPILSTVKKWPKTSHMAPPQMPQFDGHEDVPSPGLPQPPDMTIAWSEVIPVPPPLQHNPASSGGTTDVTPPMPVFQASKAATVMPSAPTRLAYQSNVMPEEPVQLASNAQHGTEMPSRPVLLAEKLGMSMSMPPEPVQLASQIPSDVGTPPEPVLLTQRLRHYIPPAHLSQPASMPQTTAPVNLNANSQMATPQNLSSVMTQEGVQHIGQTSAMVQQYYPNTMATSQNAMATSQNAMATSQNAMATSQNAMATSQNFMATSQNAMATSQNAMTTSQNAMPTSQNAMATSQNAMPTSQNGMATSQNAMATSQNTMAINQNTMATGHGAMTSQGVSGGLCLGVTPQKPAPLMRLQEAEADMPRTPELTLTYKRFVDIKAPALTNPSDTNPPATPVMRVAPYQALPQVHSGLQQVPAENGKRSGQIAPITPQEFSGVQDYLQRILPLNVINGHIDTLNQILQCKQDSNFITEEETKIVDLGAQLKVMLLLLCKLKRWEKGKSSQTNETVYFIL